MNLSENKLENAPPLIAQNDNQNEQRNKENTQSNKKMNGLWNPFIFNVFYSAFFVFLKL